MKLKYEKGKLVGVAETPEDGLDIAEIVQAAAEDGYTLTPRRHEGKVLLESHLRQRAPATPKKKTGAHEPEEVEDQDFRAPPESNGPGPAIPVGENS